MMFIDLTRRLPLWILFLHIVQATPHKPSSPAEDTVFPCSDRLFTLSHLLMLTLSGNLASPSSIPSQNLTFILFRELI